MNFSELTLMYLSWFIHHIVRMILLPNIVANCRFPRIFQHTPGTYPRPSTNSLWRNSFHLGVWGCLGYAPGVCWGSLRRLFFFTKQVIHHPSDLEFWGEQPNKYIPYLRRTFPNKAETRSKQWRHKHNIHTMVKKKASNKTIKVNHDVAVKCFLYLTSIKQYQLRLWWCHISCLLIIDHHFLICEVVGFPCSRDQSPLESCFQTSPSPLSITSIWPTSKSPNDAII